MAAGGTAEMSIGGLTINISDAGNGMSQGFSTNSIYVSYSDSLDNGMGYHLQCLFTQQVY